MLLLAGPGRKAMMNKKMAGMPQNAPFEFAPQNGLAYFEGLGWRAAEVQGLYRAAHRLRRLPVFMHPFTRLGQPDHATRAVGPGARPRC